MEHGQRYDRMDEFIDVCKALWASVEPDAFEWNRETGLVANPAKVRAINHVGRFFKVKGPLSVPPSPQGTPVLIQAGGSPRGTRTAARFVDHIFGARKPIPLMAKQREEVDAALRAQGRDPEKVGIIWSTQIMVGETEREAKAMKERLIERVPREAVGVWLSHNTGFDMSTLPPRFSLKELNERIVAANASPVGFVATLMQTHGEDGEITLEEFFDHGLKAATSYGTTVAGTAAQIADDLEERFEASGSRGGFMLRHSQAEQIEALHNIVDLLVPELRRRGRFRTAYTGRTLRENLAT
jgi:alkanesulfonate monooxygenase SsuD/methylene tetrahydromethanopterin reductase-like flavin-dependent oxidoreductase (luciferase family)